MEPEAQPTSVLVATIQEPFLSTASGDLLASTSSLSRLLRVTAWILRFCYNLRHPATPTSGPLTTDELWKARLAWVRHAQQGPFRTEIEACETRNTLPKGSKLLGTKPFLDRDGVLRVGGRLNNADLPYEIMHPIIVPAKGRLTQLMLLAAHEATLHGGAQLMTHYLRQRFWILDLRRQAKQVILRCHKCFRQRKETAIQLMGSLPSARVNPSKAFSKTGVDLCGPFQTKVRPGRCRTLLKSYGAIFVCLITRAVHIEVVSDLTTPSFVAALRRMVARRGHCEFCRRQGRIRSPTDHPKRSPASQQMAGHDLEIHHASRPSPRRSVGGRCQIGKASPEARKWHNNVHFRRTFNALRGH